VATVIGLEASVIGRPKMRRVQAAEEVGAIRRHIRPDKRFKVAVQAHLQIQWLLEGSEQLW